MTTEGHKTNTSKFFLALDKSSIKYMKSRFYLISSQKKNMFNVVVILKEAALF